MKNKYGIGDRLRVRFGYEWKDGEPSKPFGSVVIVFVNYISALLAMTPGVDTSDAKNASDAKKSEVWYMIGHDSFLAFKAESDLIPLRACNLHADCEDVDRKAKVKHEAVYHCSSDDCEDCFPK